MSGELIEFEEECRKVLQGIYTANPTTLARELTTFLSSQQDVFKAWYETVFILLDYALEANSDDQIKQVVAVITAIAFTSTAINTRDSSVFHTQPNDRYETKPGQVFSMEGAVLWADLPWIGMWMREWLNGPKNFCDDSAERSNNEKHDHMDKEVNPRKEWVNYNALGAFLIANPWARPSPSNPSPPRGLTGYEWYAEASIDEALEGHHSPNAEKWEKDLNFLAGAKWIEIAADRIYALSAVGLLPTQVQDLQFAKDIDGGRPLREGQEGFGARMSWEDGLLEAQNKWARWKKRFGEHGEVFSTTGDEELKRIAAQTVEIMENTEQRKSELA